MRLGYSYWGFLGDYKEDGNGEPLSTPDGNATYSWSIIYEALQRGWTVYQMQEDRDKPAMRRHGNGNFEAFSQHKRSIAYNFMEYTHGVDLPELDVLLLEWRMPIPGRNTPDVKGKPEYQPDLERQQQLLRHYLGTKTKIILWDLDHKLTLEEEMQLADYGGPDAIFETSVQPRVQMWNRTRVEAPTVIDDLLQFPTVHHNSFRKLAYVGSRYERDDVITEYLKPISDKFPFEVSFYGNWLKSVDECRKLWPNVDYNDRVTVRDFYKCYAEAVACPLLAKRSYIESGFISPRPWEAILFGTVPIGLTQTRGIDQYCIMHVKDGQQMIERVWDLCHLSLYERNELREMSAHRLRHMDVRYFLNKIEAVANGSHIHDVQRDRQEGDLRNGKEERTDGR